MLKTVHVPHVLLAIAQLQRASTREVAAPLYLPAFQTEILEPEARREHSDPDGGVEAGGLSIGPEDDDFY